MQITKTGKKNKLEDLLIEAWSSDASLSDNRDKAVEKINQGAVKIIAGAKGIDEDKTAYLKSLLKKINPKYLD